MMLDITTASKKNSVENFVEPVSPPSSPTTALSQSGEMG